MNIKKIKWFALLITILLLFNFAGTIVQGYTDWLWFRSLNFSSIFWTLALARVATGLFFGGIAFLIIAINFYFARNIGSKNLSWEFTAKGQNFTQVIPIKSKYINRGLIVISLLAGALFGLIAVPQWEIVLKFWHQLLFNITDPIFKKDIGFYVFSYPFYLFLQTWLFGIVIISTVAVGFIYIKDKVLNLKRHDFYFARHVKIHLSILAFIFFLLLAWKERLKMFGLLYSNRSMAVGYGAGYTDVHAQMLAHWILFVIAALCSIFFIINLPSKSWKLPIIGVSALLILSIIVGAMYPNLMQNMIVKPNELNKETPYIKYNIDYTRKAYGIDKVTEVPFPAEENLTMKDIIENEATIRNIKLWSKIPLKQTYKELQELRNYYEFSGVDVDRYTIDDTYTEVMLSAREMKRESLPEGAQTWENLHCKYTHGYGLCVSPVNTVTPEGKPKLLIKDFPVNSEFNQISRPEIYYGEKDSDYVLVNTNSSEFDYPKGDENVYTHYEGKGGIKINSLFTRAMLAAQFQAANILLTNYINENSRIMIYRNISERVKVVAPFLDFDSDPYLVISKNGQLYWMVDAYTSSDKYPYATLFPYQTNFKNSDFNYIRNSVKVTISAYDGNMNFYIVDQNDPIIKVYQKIFPSLFKDFKEMPEDIKIHIKYPTGLFYIQTIMYNTYHMDDVGVFYNKEDVWEIPTDGNKRMDGYNVIMKLPEEEKEEFIYMLPLGKGDQNMLAWMAVRCDMPNYGKLIIYKLSKEKLVFGPQQIDKLINQKTEISEKLTLWGQEGSKVEKGDLLVIPINKGIIYVRPVYLQASSGGGLPEFKRVIVVYANKIEMEETLDKALTKIFGDIINRVAKQPEIIPTVVREQLSITTSGDVKSLAKDAQGYYQQAKKSLKEGNWLECADSIKKLESVLNRLASEEQK
ncbi:MAG: UPF0182 family protein [bacterium]